MNISSIEHCISKFCNLFLICARVLTELLVKNRTFSSTSLMMKEAKQYLLDNFLHNFFAIKKYYCQN